LASAAAPRTRRLTWAAFERRLAKALAAMAPETFLVLSVPAQGDDPGYYVQFASRAEDLRAEAVGSGHLPPAQPLTVAQRERIRNLGWTEPADEDTQRNAHRTWEAPAPVGEVAALAVETLREVYGAGDPGVLRFAYEAFPAGPDTLPALPSLGIRRDEPRRSPERGRKPKRARGLRTRVEKALATWLGVPRVVPDQDGDYPIRTGSAICYLRILDGVPPAISVFSPVLQDVKVTPDLLAAIDDINGRTRYGRVFTAGPVVLVVLEIPAIDLTPAHVAFACQELGALADHLDDALHGRFGGHVAFDTSPKLLN